MWNLKATTTTKYQAHGYREHTVNCQRQWVRVGIGEKRQKVKRKKTDIENLNHIKNIDFIYIHTCLYIC